MLKNITLSADEELIRKARKKANKENTTVNEGDKVQVALIILSERLVRNGFKTKQCIK